MTQITIDISKLTPAQAFELGKMLQQKTEVKETKVTKVTTRTVRGKGKTSKRFKFNTKAPDHVIEEAVSKRRSGMQLAQLAEYLNSQGETGPKGRKFTSQSVWDVVYSKQAWKFWQA